MPIAFQDMPNIPDGWYSDNIGVTTDGAGNTFVGVSLGKGDNQMVQLHRLDASGVWSKVQEWATSRKEISKPGNIDVSVRGTALLIVVTLRDGVQQPFYALVPNVATPIGGATPVTVINNTTTAPAPTPSSSGKDDQARKDVLAAQIRLGKLEPVVAGLQAALGQYVTVSQVGDIAWAKANDAIFAAVTAAKAGSTFLSDFVWAKAGDRAFAMLKERGLIK